MINLKLNHCTFHVCWRNLIVIYLGVHLYVHCTILPPPWDWNNHIMILSHGTGFYYLSEQIGLSCSSSTLNHFLPPQLSSSTRYQLSCPLIQKRTANHLILYRSFNRKTKAHRHWWLSPKNRARDFKQTTEIPQLIPFFLYLILGFLVQLNLSLSVFPFLLPQLHLVLLYYLFFFPSTSFSSSSTQIDCNESFRPSTSIPLFSHFVFPFLFLFFSSRSLPPFCFLLATFCCLQSSLLLLLFLSLLFYYSLILPDSSLFHISSSPIKLIAIHNTSANLEQVREREKVWGG